MDYGLDKWKERLSLTAPALSSTSFSVLPIRLNDQVASSRGLHIFILILEDPHQNLHLRVPLIFRGIALQIRGILAMGDLLIRVTWNIAIDLDTGYRPI